MGYSKTHDHLVKNGAVHNKVLDWMRSNAHFLIGIEKFFLMMRDDLAHFVHNQTGIINSELIDDHSRKGHFNLLDVNEKSVLSDIKAFRKDIKSRGVHDRVVLDYLNQLEVHCSFLQKYVRPQLSGC